MRETSRNDDNAAEERKNALAVWRGHGMLVRRQAGLEGTELDARVSGVFEAALIDEYWRPIGGILESLEVEKKAWAASIGVDRTTLYRWPRAMKFRDFVFTLTAFDIDLGKEVRWPEVERVALAPYVEAFMDIQVEALQAERRERPSVEDVLCLYLTARSWPLVQGRIEKDGLICEGASRWIGRQASMYLDCPIWVTGFKDVQRAIDGREDAWAVLETVVNYEWIE